MNVFQITLDENTRSYATKENLIKGIERFGIGHIRHIVCKTEDDRWTAIFIVSAYLNKNGGFAGIASQYGFMSV